MKRRRRESALNDFLDALASKKAGGLTGDSFSGIDLNGESLIGVDFSHCVFDNSIFMSVIYPRQISGIRPYKTQIFAKPYFLSPISKERIVTRPISMNPGPHWQSLMMRCLYTLTLAAHFYREFNSSAPISQVQFSRMRS